MDEGDRQERFHLIYQANYASILGYILRRAQSNEDAADIVAETFLTAWRRLDHLPSAPEARLWLYGVARRLLANYRRGERRRSRLAERLREDISRVPEGAEPGGPWEVEGVKRALAELREEDREIIGLVAWEGLSHDELGQILGCSPNAAKIRLHRARRRLMARLTATGIAVKRSGWTGHGEGGRVPTRPAIEEEW